MSEDLSNELLVSVENGVMVMTMNRPQAKNAMKICRN